MHLWSSHATHVGLRRKNNEDALRADDARGLYAVADGVGGQPDGEIASRLAVARVVWDDRLLAEQHLVWTAFRFDAAFSRIHADLCAVDDRVAKPSGGMATTLTACAFEQESDGLKLRVAHCGDSSLFLVPKDAPVEKVTRDHNSRWLADKVGRWPRYRFSCLENCLGLDARAFRGAEHFEGNVCPGDRVVLATDGVTRYLIDLNFLRSVGGAAGLVDFALRRSGEDNATAIVVEVEK